MSQAQQLPFAGDVCQAAEQELAETADVLHLAEDRLHDVLAFRVTGTPRGFRQFLPEEDGRG